MEPIAWLPQQTMKLCPESCVHWEWQDQPYGMDYGGAQIARFIFQTMELFHLLPIIKFL